MKMKWDKEITFPILAIVIDFDFYRKIHHHFSVSKAILALPEMVCFFIQVTTLFQFSI